jgi:hypothetical protein
MTPARQLASTVLGCAAGAGLILFASTRTWSTQTVVRPAPLPVQVLTHSGAQLYPALPALALVGLAAAGALLATRGRARLAVGLLQMAVGIAVVAGTVVAELGTAAVPAVWFVACQTGALVVGAAGGYTVRHGRGWPAMGTRYERGARAPVTADASSAQVWDAIDRGDDPTAVGGTDGHV